MQLIVLLSVLVLCLLIAMPTLVLRGSKRYSWAEFYFKTKTAGMSLAESRRLREAAVSAGLRDPTNVLWSPRDMDKTIAVLASWLKHGGRERGREGVLLMDRVYDLRKGIEFEQPRFKLGIRSSRQIGAGQRLRVLVQGVGVFDSMVMDNLAHSIVISFPIGNRLPAGWVWKGKKVSIYFWRRDDAGYVFDSYVIDDLRIRSFPGLHVSHSEALLRTQRRKSVRTRSKIPAYLYLLRRIEGAYEKLEMAPGLRSLVQDLSEDGAAVAIGGKGVPGLQVKLQFGLDERSVVMSGTVRSVDFDAEANRSVLHVQAVMPSPRMRNAIRSFVYTNRADAEVVPHRGAE